MNGIRFFGGSVILTDQIWENAAVTVEADRIRSVEKTRGSSFEGVLVDLEGGFLAPGFVDLHVHGGDGADFMDGDAEAFRKVCRAHARHGTTSLLATTTVARHEQHLEFLRICQALKGKDTGGATILGAHFYGPYFGPEACGCHPSDSVRPPVEGEYRQYLEFADTILTATVAPELPGAREFVKACRERGIRCNAGHSHATFEQVEQAISWGVRHVDHLFCAMSDRARLRQSQPYPMRGGVMEATLYFDSLTTEVIADGKHLAPELLCLAWKIKGADRLALVTDANRALDQPDGPYIFGPREGGEPIIRRDDVGLTRDGKALASGVMGMDQMVRTMWEATGASLPEVIRMATLTPARIAGVDAERGSIAIGKVADLVWLDADLRVRGVWVSGRRVHGGAAGVS